MLSVNPVISTKVEKGGKRMAVLNHNYDDEFNGIGLGVRRKNTTLREKVEVRVLEILNATPGNQIKLSEIISILVNDFNRRDKTLYQYIGSNDFVEKFKAPGTNYISVRLINSSQNLPFDQEKEININALVTAGESDKIEFKSTLSTNLHTGDKDTRIIHSALKTIAGFLNTTGGTLIIGVSDDGNPIGLDKDGFQNEDKMSLHLINLIEARMGMRALTFTNLHFEDFKDRRVLIVIVNKGVTPTYLLDESKKENFYIRTGPSTRKLKLSETQEFIKQRFD